MTTEYMTEAALPLTLGPLPVLHKFIDARIMKTILKGVVFIISPFFEDVIWQE